MAGLSGAQWGRIFALAWHDANFKSAFEENPRKALDDNAARLGIDAGTTFTLPAKPGDFTGPQIEEMANPDGRTNLVLCSEYSC